MTLQDTAQHRTTELPVFDSAGPELAAYYEENGFALLRDALGPQQVAEINDEALRLCHRDLITHRDPEDPADLRGSVGLRDDRDDRDDRGRASQDRASSVSPLGPDPTDEEVLRRYLCIHYPHKISDAARRAMSLPGVVDVLTSVIGPNVKAMQSMLFIKSEGKPGQAWHQDEYFIPTRDRSLTAVWIALDDATVENGCLWVLPGSHRRGVLYPSREQVDPRFDCTTEAHDFPYADSDAVPVEVPAGTALVFNGYLLHRSLENSGMHGYRRALVNHYMSAESLLGWRLPAEGEHMGMADYRDIVMVAGEDPYAFKGTPELSAAYSRADKDGGCDR